MAKKDQTETLLQRLEDGTAEIYSRYENLIRTSAAAKEKKKREIEQDYKAAANEASAQAQIGLNNSLEKMADNGYLRSGETVQATLSANASRLGALNRLAVQKARDLGDLEAEQLQIQASLRNDAEKEAADFRSEAERTAREQANRDREFEAEENQRQFENRMEEEKLQWEKEKDSADSRGNSNGNSQGEPTGFTPEKSAYDYLDDIVERNTEYDPQRGYRVVDRSAILRALTQLIRDPEISYRYRYEMYLYAKSLGYLQTEE